MTSTAHNSFVLCLAELGLVGTTLWVALLVTSITSLNKDHQATERIADETGRCSKRGSSGRVHALGRRPSIL